MSSPKAASSDPWSEWPAAVRTSRRAQPWVETPSCVTWQGLLRCESGQAARAAGATLASQEAMASEPGRSPCLTTQERSSHLTLCHSTAPAPSTTKGSIDRVGGGRTEAPSSTGQAQVHTIERESSHAARRAPRGLENTTPSLFSPSKLKVQYNRERERENVQSRQQSRRLLLGWARLGRNRLFSCHKREQRSSPPGFELFGGVGYGRARPQRSSLPALQRSWHRPTLSS